MSLFSIVAPYVGRSLTISAVRGPFSWGDEKCGASVQVVLLTGVRAGATGPLIADHAWVRCGDRSLLEIRQGALFTAKATIGKYPTKEVKYNLQNITGAKPI